uniref:Uncharacterized protein n=1 Tax=Arundo donax TaxID=35708 RepID=A0A0A9B5E6_ARUDO
MEKGREKISQGKTLVCLNHSAVHLGRNHRSMGDTNISALHSAHHR